MPAPFDVPELVNPYDVTGYITVEMKDAVRRAIQAGARPPFVFVGAGQYGIVLCETFEGGHAFKVFRGAAGADVRHRRFLHGCVRDELEWLVDASNTEIASHVAAPYGADLENFVVERECIPGRAGTWGDGTRLSDVHHRIEKAMEPVGWTAPEFKESSYIIRPDGKEVLVDISMALRIGPKLVDYVEGALVGRFEVYETWHDLAFFVLGERREKTISEEKAKELLDRLVERDPSIAEGFSLKGAV